MFSILSRRILLVSLVCGIVVLLTACGSSNAGTGTFTTNTLTTPSNLITPSPSAPTPLVSPTQKVTPTPSSENTNLTVIFSCGGQKGDGFNVGEGHGKACVRTLPGAQLKLTVNYCNGLPDASDALQHSVVADQNGFYEWDWTPVPDCKGQPIWSWKAVVVATSNGQTAQANTQGMA